MFIWADFGYNRASLTSTDRFIRGTRRYIVEKERNYQMKKSTLLFVLVLSLSLLVLLALAGHLTARADDPPPTLPGRL